MSEVTNPTRETIRDVISEFLRGDAAKQEPALKQELEAERAQRAALEKRLAELEADNKAARSQAEQSERYASIKSTLSALGVKKVELAFRAVKDDVRRDDSGRLVAGDEAKPLQEFLAAFVAENAEFQDPKTLVQKKEPPKAEGFDLSKIVPGMSPEERAKVHAEVSRLALEQFASDPAPVKE